MANGWRKYKFLNVPKDKKKKKREEKNTLLIILILETVLDIFL